MKIGISEVNEGIYFVAKEKLRKSLEREGFHVVDGNKEDMYDLYAENGNDRRIYEIKIGKNKTQRRVLSKLQEIASSMNAKLFVTYLEQPKSSQIEYDGVEDLLLEYLMNNMPDELDALSTHTMLQAVSGVEINSIKIINNMIKIEGNANLKVELLYGSEHDRNGEDGFNDYYDFFYRASIVDEKIVQGYFKFDLEPFYE